jgi:hypothetical protein
MQDAERALTRALGPVVKAEEIPPKLWRVWQEAGRHGFTRSQMQPQAGPELWGMGSAFLLRETELAHLLMGSVSLDLERREVTLLLSMSKTDPGGKGARRTRSCVCSWPPEEEGEMDYPFHATVKVMAGRTKVLRGMGYEEEELKEFTVVGQVGCPALMVSKEAMIAALRKDAEEGKGNGPLFKQVRGQGRCQEAWSPVSNGPMARPLGIQCGPRLCGGRFGGDARE